MRLEKENIRPAQFTGRFFSLPFVIDILSDGQYGLVQLCVWNCPWNITLIIFLYEFHKLEGILFGNLEISLEFGFYRNNLRCQFESQCQYFQNLFLIIVTWNKKLKGTQFSNAKLHGNQIFVSGRKAAGFVALSFCTDNRLPNIQGLTKIAWLCSSGWITRLSLESGLQSRKYTLEEKSNTEVKKCQE